MSLRWRIALAFALVAPASGAIGVVVYGLSGQDLLSRGRARAVAQVTTAAHYYALTEPLISAPALQPNDPSIPPPLRQTVRTGHLATYRGSWKGQAVIWAGGRRRTGGRRSSSASRSSQKSRRSPTSGTS